MKSKIKIAHLVIPIGMLLTTCALIISVRTDLPDYVKGLCFGVAVGVLLSPIFIKKLRSSN